MTAANMSVKHGRTRAEARVCLRVAVALIRARFGLLIRRVEWSGGGDAVRIQGLGFAIDMRVDDEQVDVSGDIPLLGGVLNSPMVPKLKQIVRDTFQKRLT